MICIVTAYTPSVPEWKELGELASQTMREYADRHGLDLKVFTDGFDLSRHPSWSKIQFIKKVLPDYEWVWWLDADAAITNQKIDVKSFLESKADILVCKDVEECMFNMGSFFIRNCPFSFGILDEMWNREKWANKELWEQSALLDMVREGKMGDRLAIFNSREFNGMCDWHAERHRKIPNEALQWHAGDFVAHCAGYWMPHRISILKEVIGLTVR